MTGCGDCAEDSPLRVARRRYDELMARWNDAQARLVAKAGLTPNLPPELAKLVAEERKVRGELLEAQEALTQMMYAPRR